MYIYPSAVSVLRNIAIVPVCHCEYVFLVFGLRVAPSLGLAGTANSAEVDIPVVVGDGDGVSSLGGGMV